MNKRIVIEFGHTLEEYQEKFGQEYEQGNLWDFAVEEVFNGTIEAENLDNVYWLIDGRLYETECQEEVK